jgi:hypothetical protein
MDRVIAAQAAATGATLEAVRDELTRTVSLRTFVSAQDIANMAFSSHRQPGRASAARNWSWTATPRPFGKPAVRRRCGKRFTCCWGS